MCLYIGRKEGHIAKNDIICYKELIEVSKGVYETPCQNWPVTLDTMLVPEGKAKPSELGFKYEISSGAIHAYLGTNGEQNSNYFEARIPAGTRYWIQDDLKEIAAEKLYLTSKRVPSGKPVTTPNWQELYQYGNDVILSDGSIHSLLAGDYNLSDVRGIRAYDEHFMALPISKEPMQFSITALDKFGTEDWEKAKKDSNGKKNSDELEKKFGLDKLSALKFARDNGGYLPAEEQLMKAFLELEGINLTRQFLGLDLIPYAWFWSSTVRNSDSVWGCGSDGDAWDWGYWGNYRYTELVCLFLSSH